MAPRWALLGFALVFSPLLKAQSLAGLGALSGMIVDESGAAVPGATVVVRNEKLGIRRELQTTEAGMFNAPSLAPADGYRVSIHKAGFSPVEVTAIRFPVGQVVSLNRILRIATVETQIDVTSAAPLAEQMKTGVSEVVNNSQIMNLPINGRRVDSFVLLTPAVAPEGTSGLLTFRGIPGGNAFLTDGNDTTNQLWNENAGRARISSNISQDAVQEFQVLSSNYSAELGRAAGGIVNTVTRSGANDRHATLFWFFRNRDFNARDRYATFNPEETRHQAGGSVGGSFVKDRLFYFFNAELTRRQFPIVSSLNRPPLFDAAGNFVATCVATPQQCEAATRYFGRFSGSWTAVPTRIFSLASSTGGRARQTRSARVSICWIGTRRTASRSQPCSTTAQPLEATATPLSRPASPASRGRVS